MLLELFHYHLVVIVVVYLAYYCINVDTLALTLSHKRLIRI